MSVGAFYLVDAPFRAATQGPIVFVVLARIGVEEVSGCCSAPGRQYKKGCIWVCRMKHSGTPPKSHAVTNHTVPLAVCMGNDFDQDREFEIAGATGNN